MIQNVSRMCHCSKVDDDMFFEKFMCEATHNFTFFFDSIVPRDMG